MMNQIFPDIPRFFTAVAEWAACLVFILTLRRRIKGWRLAGASAVMFLVQSGFLIVTGNVGLELWVPCMVTAVLLMTGYIFLGCEVHWKDAVYCGLQAFVTAEFAASLEWQIYCYFFHDRSSLIWRYFVLFVLYGCIYVVIWWLLNRQQTAEKVLHIQNRELGSALIIAIAVFAFSNLSFLSVDTPFSSSYGEAVATIRTMVDLGGVAMMYAHYVQLFEIRARRELDVMQNMLQNQYLQYQQSKESIELINFKYHDLKHQIAVLRAEESAEKRNEYLDRMEEEIHQYEVQNKTGNKVLDTVLTSKSVTCEKFGISLNCVADGTLLDFMDVMDICSILGNALDNAIECEKKIQEKEKRLIHVAIFAQKNFLIMRFENYFEGELAMQEGIPVTTKTKKKEFHGYGIKSIQYAVKKYGGAASINTRDNWFELKVLIPLPAEK